MKSSVLIFILINIWSCVYLLKISLDLKKDLGNKDKNPFADLSDAELDKMMKQYGLDSKDLGILSPDSKTDKKSVKDTGKKNSKDLLLDLNLEDDPLKSLLDGDKKKKKGPPKPTINEIFYKNKEILKKFELKQRDAFNLIYFMSKFNVFNKLPITAMNIINEVYHKPSFQHIYKLNKNHTEVMNYIISNTPNSQTYIDQENKVGRKGLLNIVDKDTAEIKPTWTVLNSRVFVFYKSSNYLKIIKIFRISFIRLKDLLYSPCFFLYYDNNEFSNFKNSQVMVCAINYREKEYWIRTLEHHREQYKDFILENKVKK